MRSRTYIPLGHGESPFWRGYPIGPRYVTANSESPIYCSASAWVNLNWAGSRIGIVGRIGNKSGQPVCKEYAIASTEQGGEAKFLHPPTLTV